MYGFLGTLSVSLCIAVAWSNVLLLGRPLTSPRTSPDLTRIRLCNLQQTSTPRTLGDLLVSTGQNSPLICKSAGLGVAMAYVRTVVGLESLGLDILVGGETGTVGLMAHVPFHRLWRC